jgi:hypothetical protein
LSSLLLALRASGVADKRMAYCDRGTVFDMHAKWSAFYFYFWFSVPGGREASA